MRVAHDQQIHVASGSHWSSEAIAESNPPWLPQGASLRDAAQALIETGAWGIMVLDGSRRYVGACTLRSLVGATLHPQAEPGFAAPRIQAVFDRPVTQSLDLEVPAVRVSTALPQLLTVLCRRSPIVPIVSDSGMRLLGVVTLASALRAALAS